MSTESNQAVYPAAPQYAVADGKVPIDPKTGKRIDAQDAANHMSRVQATQIAAAQRWNVGFVLTDGDPYWCLDLDNCRDPVTGRWTDFAIEIALKFPGHLQEVSISGTGLHIWGRFQCQEGWEVYRTRDNDRGLEFYYRKRFIVINPATAAGRCE